jgi:hypothetical protein
VFFAADLTLYKRRVLLYRFFLDEVVALIGITVHTNVPPYLSVLGFAIHSFYVVFSRLSKFFAQFTV